MKSVFKSTKLNFQQMLKLDKVQESGLYSSQKVDLHFYGIKFGLDFYKMLQMEIEHGNSSKIFKNVHIFTIEKYFIIMTSNQFLKEIKSQ